jgi:recombinational DNA repair protein (RecF pathway)
MIAEMALRTSSDEAASGLFDSIELAFDRLSAADPEETIAAALAGAWHIISTLGFTPAIDVCANCHADLDPAARVTFSHRAGGALCPRCGAAAAGSRALPPEARTAIRGWVNGDASVVPLTDAESRAHQRLLREFFQEHMGTSTELRAFKVWEGGQWTAA